MTEQEHRRKLIRLQWLMDRADEFDTKIYDEEIESLSSEIHEYEEKEHSIKPPSIQGLLLYHLDRTGLKKKEMASKMDISEGYFSRILRKDCVISEKMKDKIMNFNYKSL